MSRIDLIDELTTLKDMVKSIERLNNPILYNDRLTKFLDQRIQKIESTLSNPSKSKRRRLRKKRLSTNDSHYSKS